MELRDISFDIVSEEIYKEILLEILPEAEAACFEVNISYRGGNPPLKMLDKLIKQPWFTANQIKAEDYLKTDLYDFYITMHTYSYRVEKLTEDEQEHLKGSLEEIEQALDEKYGEYADYEVNITE